MTIYNVTVPVAGAFWIQVEADSKEEAVDKAMKKWPLDIEVKKEFGNVDLLELDMFQQLVEGNIVYSDYNKIEVEEE